MRVLYCLLLAASLGVLTSCGGEAETVADRDPISRLWIPVNGNSIDLYFNNLFLNLLDVPISFYDNTGAVACTCSSFFTGTPTKGVYNMECPDSCQATYTRFETDNGTYEVSDTNIMTICPQALRPDLCVEYK